MQTTSRSVSRLGALLPALAAVLAGQACGEDSGRGDVAEHRALEAANPHAYRIVVFRDPPAASYAGGIDGLRPTRPTRGRKLDVRSPAVVNYRGHLAEAQRNYRAYLGNKAPSAVVVREYFYALNAVAVELNGASPGTLAAGPGVRDVYDSVLYQPRMTVSTDLIRAVALWTDAGGRDDAGDGIAVGIIDSGIDAGHPLFACKGDIPAKVYASGVAFDPSNVLVSDHGTHVAGTVAGCVTELEGLVTGPISGVAPGAALYDYNVFPGFGAGYVAFGGSAFSHDIAAALEDAIADGVDVVNMSLGGSVQGPHDFLAEAVNHTVDAGLVVAVAAGNSGPGDATVESPGSAAGALTAGATTNPHFVGIPVTVGGSTFGAALGDFASFGVVTASYTTTSPANGCTTISTALAGKLALIDRGACTFATKIRNAEAAGAIGVLVANSAAGDPVSMGHDGGAMPTIPAAMVSKGNGASMKPSGTASIDGTAPAHFITANEDILASFSSRGPTPFTDLIKPDLTAPGVNVYSSVFDGGYAFFQGTSMATPHLAGSAVLLRHLHPDWSPADVKSALVNTAARVVTDHGDGAVDPGVLARGGGRADLEAAHRTPLTFDPASASFGSVNGNAAADHALALAVRNVSGATQACGVAVTGPALVTATSAALELAAGGTGTLSLTLSGGKATKTPSGDYDGDVVVTCGSTVLRVPWWVRIDRKAVP